MALYKKEGANPVAGCLPIVVQIPIFFSLYKVLFVTIEMYHAPFYGWLQDLSAPDPLGILTLFGIIPWNVPPILSLANIGILPIFMGFTMWLQQKLNPAPTDPTQAKIFAFLPFVFTFILAGFAAGLVLYWSVNNILSIAQQWLIQRKILAKKDLEPICILVGPEGDFSENERNLIINLEQSQSISLAPNILRAETAAVVAVTLANYHLNLS